MSSSARFPAGRTRCVRRHSAPGTASSGTAFLRPHFLDSREELLQVVVGQPPVGDASEENSCRRVLLHVALRLVPDTTSARHEVVDLELEFACEPTEDLFGGHSAVVLDIA